MVRERGPTKSSEHSSGRGNRLVREGGLQRTSSPQAAPGDPIGRAPPSGRQDGAHDRMHTAGGRPSLQRIEGKLLDHGIALYRDDPRQGGTFFVKIQTPEGQRQIWGQDLGRAMKESVTRPLIGDEITLQEIPREPLGITRQKRDAGTQPDSGRWVVERIGFFRARAAAASALRDPSIKPKDALRQHPELIAPYHNLMVAKTAARAIRDREDQHRFLFLVRSALADQVERGEPLQPVRFLRLFDGTPAPVRRGRQRFPDLTPARA